VTTDTDRRFMQMALALGRRGQGRVWPNPAVGCVIVKDGRIVGRGRTADGGRPHAEVQALAMAGDAARDATAYVTLEPCAHTGKTGPCAEALVAAGVKRVVSALKDPDPRVNGSGHQILRSAGVVVEENVCFQEAAADLSGFINRIKRGRPELTLKLATSFDGRIATASGESQWITGPAARRRVHGMRARHDAVLVGAGTAREDDPSLTVRGLGERPQPVRVIASRRLNIPEDGILARTAEQTPVWICHGEGEADPALIERWSARGADLLPVATQKDGQLDMSSLLNALGRKGLTRIFCEGGGALAASLISADFVDRLVGFTAGLALGAEGRPSVGAIGLEKLAEAPRFDLVSVEEVSGDVLHIWTRQR